MIWILPFLQYPGGFLENKQQLEKPRGPSTSKPKAKKGKKRVLEDSPDPQPKAAAKKAKKSYVLEESVSLTIEKDELNSKLWEECTAVVSDGKIVSLNSFFKVHCAVIIKKIIFIIERFVIIWK